MTQLTVTGLSKRFDGGNVVLAGVSLAVESGEFLVLLGPSGSGKTTLLRCIAGLTDVTSGSIVLGDRVVVDDDVNLPTHKRDLGMVFQSFALWPHMTVRENVGYPIASRGRRDFSRVDEMLRLVHCGELADRLPATLSGGQQQRVALARGLAASPALLLFDEPLSNLDALLREELRGQLRAIHRETRFTGVYVTHDQVEALSLGTRVAVMNRGRIEQIAVPEEIYGSPHTEFVAEFMGMMNCVRLRADGQVDLTGSGGLGALSLRFRPDAVSLGNAGDAQGPSRWQIDDLRVIDRAFTGALLEYALARNALTLKVRVAADAARFQIGDAVQAKIAPHDAAVFRDGLRVDLPTGTA